MSLHRLMSRKPAFWLAVVLLVLALLPMTAAAAEPNGQTTTRSPLDYRADPVLVVASYYNAINLNDYARAYGYWENPPKGATLAQFAAGYTDTVGAAAFVRLPAASDAGAGNIFAAVPVLLAADHTDGSQHFYAGCFTVHKVNVPVGSAPEPDPDWHLNSALMREVTTFDLSLLDSACQQTETLASVVPNLTSPVSLLSSYYGAIMNRDYARAYGYWENPPEPTLQQFAQGFANTNDVSVIVRLDALVEGAAGSSYASLPTLVTSTLSSGTRQFFTGCLTARRVNVPQGNEGSIDPDWRLYESHMTEVSTIPAGMNLLDGACSV